VQTVAGKRNDREADTLARMQAIAAGLIGRRLMYKRLIADNGLTAEAVQSDCDANQCDGGLRVPIKTEENPVPIQG